MICIEYEVPFLSKVFLFIDFGINVDSEFLFKALE